MQCGGRNTYLRALQQCYYGMWLCLRFTLMRIACMYNCNLVIYLALFVSVGFTSITLILIRKQNDIYTYSRLLRHGTRKRNIHCHNIIDLLFCLHITKKVQTKFMENRQKQAFKKVCLQHFFWRLMREYNHFFRYRYIYPINNLNIFKNCEILVTRSLYVTASG